MANTMAEQRGGKCAFDIPPTIINSLSDCVRVNSSDLGPFRHCFGDSVQGEKPIITSISTLLKPCGPTTIRRLVVSIVINAIKRMVCARTWSHISDEILKCLPSFAHGYSASAVAKVVRSVRVATSVHHQTPNTIFGCLSLAVTDAAEPLVFNHPAAATRNSPIAQKNALSDVLVSAVAKAYPSRPSLLRAIRVETEHTKSSELLPCNVLKITVHSSLNYSPERGFCLG